MSIIGSGVSRFAQLASNVPNGPRRAVTASPKVVSTGEGDGHGFSHVEACERLSISCRYAIGLNGDRQGGGTQSTSEPSGLIGWKPPLVVPEETVVGGETFCACAYRDRPMGLDGLARA